MTDSVSAQEQQPNAATTAPAAAAEPVSTEAAAAAAGAVSAAPAGAPASERARRSGGQRRGGGDRRGGRGGAPRQGAAPQGDAATAQGPAGDGAARTPPRTTHPLLEQLADLYPHLFGAVFRPLKRGVFQDLLAAHPEAFDRDALKVALGLHTRSTRYLQSVAAGDKRHDLAGQPVEAMAPEHVHHALLEVYRRRKNNKARATEDLLPKLRNRMMAAFEASGMSRETYTELVRGRDDAANAILEEAFAEWSARNAKDEALLRAFEASGQTLEAFADMYGMVARTVGQQLERARRLNAARAQQAADAAAAASASAAPAATAATAAPAASAESAAPAEHADATAAAPAAPAQDH